MDVLVSNAGIMPVSRSDELDVNGWEAMVDVNPKGVPFGIAAHRPGLAFAKNPVTKRSARNAR